MRNIHIQFQRGHLQQGQRASRDVLRQIAHPLEIGIDLQNRRQEPQVARHRLLQHQQPRAELIHFLLHTVDGRLPIEHHLRQTLVTVDKRAHAAVDGRFDHPTHLQ